MRKLELGSSVRIGELELTVVDSVRIEHPEEGLWFFAAKEPVLVLVKELGATRAYSIDGEPVSPGTLREILPPEMWKKAGIEE